MHALVKGTARQPLCSRTGMAWPGLVCWLRIFLIRAGSSESGAPSPLAAAGTLCVRLHLLACERRSEARSEESQQPNVRRYV